MFSRLKSWFNAPPSSGEKIASQPPGEMFPWPRLTRLTMLEDVVLAIPAATLGKDEQIGSVIHADVDAGLSLPKTAADQYIYIRLKEGMSVWLSKSVQSVVVADDKKPRRIRISTVDSKEADPVGTDNDRAAPRRV